MSSGTRLHLYLNDIIDVNIIRFVAGFPIALSYPHFYKSDPSLLEAIEGLEPTKDLHESYFFIQPKSGLPVDLAFRFQINMALQDIGHMARVEKFSKMTLPLLWFEIVSIKYQKICSTKKIKILFVIFFSNKSLVKRLIHI